MNNVEFFDNLINDIEISISLNQKLTLEDKAIVDLFYRIKNIVHEAMNKNVNLDNKLYALKDISSSINEYIKVVRFNYNYYEQYFAYNLLIKLQSLFDEISN